MPSSPRPMIAASFGGGRVHSCVPSLSRPCAVRAVCAAGPFGRGARFPALENRSDRSNRPVAPRRRRPQPRPSPADDRDAGRRLLRCRPPSPPTPWCRSSTARRSTAGRGSPSSGAVEDGAIVGETTRREADQGQHLPDLAAGQRRRLRTQAAVPDHGRQQRHPVPQPRSRRLRRRRLPGRLRGGHEVLRDHLRGAGPRHPRPAWASGSRSPPMARRPRASRSATTEDLQKAIKPGEWNDYRIVAKGPKLQHFINGQLMSETVDEQVDKRAARGHPRPPGARRAADEGGVQGHPPQAAEAWPTAARSSCWWRAGRATAPASTSIGPA